MKLNFDWSCQHCGEREKMTLEVPPGEPPVAHLSAWAAWCLFLLPLLGICCGNILTR